MYLIHWLTGVLSPCSFDAPAARRWVFCFKWWIFSPLPHRRREVAMRRQLVVYISRLLCFCVNYCFNFDRLSTIDIYMSMLSTTTRKFLLLASNTPNTITNFRSLHNKSPHAFGNQQYQIKLNQDRFMIFSDRLKLYRIVLKSFQKQITAFFTIIKNNVFFSHCAFQLISIIPQLGYFD